MLLYRPPQVIVDDGFFAMTVRPVFQRDISACLYSIEHICEIILPYVVFAVTQRQPLASKLFVFQARCRTNVRPDVWGDAERLQMKGYSMCRHRPECSVARQADAGVITDPPPAGFEKRPCSRHPGVTAVPHFLPSTSSFHPSVSTFP